MTSDTNSRLLVVSNRLPITIKHNRNGNFEFLKSSGGLVSALSSLSKTMPFQWCGWTGPDVPEEKFAEISDHLQREYSATSIQVDDDLADRYYNGFCNSILWPLLHYEDIEFDNDAWSAYVRVNRIFAKQLVGELQDGDLIWVQDYHLMLLPAMIREEVDPSKKVKIGFFLHTPFPTYEKYRAIPKRKEVLAGLLSCDLVGFHTNDYGHHFLESCEKILDVEREGPESQQSQYELQATLSSSIMYRNRTTCVRTFPIGIEPNRFADTVKRPNVRKRIAELERQFNGRKIIIGIDRLDYIKALPHKLRAFESFLTKHREWTGKVVLIQIAVPSRQKVDKYQRLREDINENVGRINSELGTIEFMPIVLLHRSVDQDELTALYAVSDVCLVSSIRDGMNLVCFEYVAAQAAKEQHGVLVLSEFTGAAVTLNKGSLVMNPHYEEQHAESIYKALTLSDEERENNFRSLEEYVSKHTSAFWGSSFVDELKRIKPQLLLSPNFDNMEGAVYSHDGEDLNDCVAKQAGTNETCSRPFNDLDSLDGTMSDRSNSGCSPSKVSSSPTGIQNVWFVIDMTNYWTENALNGWKNLTSNPSKESLFQTPEDVPSYTPVTKICSTIDGKNITTSTIVNHAFEALNENSGKRARVVSSVS